MKLNREDFKGIEDDLGWCDVQQDDSSNSIIYNTLLKDEIGCLVILGWSFTYQRMYTVVQVHNTDRSVELCIRNERLQSPDEVVKWVITTIRRLEYHAKELRDN